jgi:hypothetical protein
MQLKKFNKKIIHFVAILMMALLLSPSAWAEQKGEIENGKTVDEVAFSDQPLSIELSVENINRIYCAEPIKKISAPEAMKLTVEYQDKNAFLKLDEKSKKGVIYAITESGSVFTLQITPKAGLGAKTITLDLPNKKARDNASVFANLDRETATVDLITCAFKDEIPESYTVSAVGKEEKAIESLKIVQKRRVSIDGVSLELKEYVVGIAPFSGLSEVRVDEATFLTPKLTRQPVGIALGKDLDGFVQGKVILKPSEYLRLFIVEKKNE